MTLAQRNPAFIFERAAMAASPTFSATECGAEPYMVTLAGEYAYDAAAVQAPEHLIDSGKLLAAIAVAVGEQESGVSVAKKDKKKDLSSGPPSPPDSGSTTPRLTIAPCPARLRESLPPDNYSSVEPHTIFRSSFPLERNVKFLQTLGVRSVLTLVDTELSDAYAAFIRDNNIKHETIIIDTNKEGVVNSTLDSLCRALLFVLDKSNQPVYIHCNKGKHRTGCIIGCLRRIQRVPIKDIIDEYDTYAGLKARPGDVKLIKQFDPETVYTYAVENGYLGEKPAQRLDSAVADTDTEMGSSALATNGGSSQDLLDWMSSGIAVTEGESSDTAGLQPMRTLSPTPIEDSEDNYPEFGTVIDAVIGVSRRVVLPSLLDMDANPPSVEQAPKRTKEVASPEDSDSETTSEGEVRASKVPKLEPTVLEKSL